MRPDRSQLHPAAGFDGPPESPNSPCMIHYHVWFNLKSEVTEDDGLAAARDFIAELTGQGKIARAQLLKNSGDAAKSRLPLYHALFEFKDDAQMTETFAAKRTEGIHAGPHGRLIASVSEFRVEIFREV